MPAPVFISYARSASKMQALALAERLGALAFFDTQDIDDGEHFPQRLLDGVLDARIVVIFAAKTYVERRFCRLEMRLALAGGDLNAKHLVIALGEGSNAVLDALPAKVADQNWPSAAEMGRLYALVQERLQNVLA